MNIFTFGVPQADCDQLVNQIPGAQCVNISTLSTSRNETPLVVASEPQYTTLLLKWIDQQTDEEGIVPEPIFLYQSDDDQSDDANNPFKENSELLAYVDGVVTPHNISVLMEWLLRPGIFEAQELADSVPIDFIRHVQGDIASLPIESIPLSSDAENSRKRLEEDGLFRHHFNEAIEARRLILGALLPAPSLVMRIVDAASDWLSALADFFTATYQESRDGLTVLPRVPSNEDSTVLNWRDILHDPGAILQGNSNHEVGVVVSQESLRFHDCRKPDEGTVPFILEILREGIVLGRKMSYLGEDGAWEIVLPHSEAENLWHEGLDELRVTPTSERAAG
jgi:hypothetical protein